MLSEAKGIQARNSRKNATEESGSGERTAVQEHSERFYHVDVAGPGLQLGRLSDRRQGFVFSFRVFGCAYIGQECV